MTQVFSENVGARNLGGANSNQFPTANIYDVFETLTNRQVDNFIRIDFDNAMTVSEDIIMTFVAPEDGIIRGLEYANGAIAANGSNGWELQFLNKTNGDAVVSYFGIGSGTEASKATDVDTAVPAGGSAFIRNTLTERINKGDTINCIGDRDGTTIVGGFNILFSGESEGR